MSETVTIARWRKSARLYCGVFLMFAPVGLLIGLASEPVYGWGAGAATAVFSAVLSILWMATFRERMLWLLVPANVIPFVARWVYFGPLDQLGFLEWGAHDPEPVRRIVLAVSAVCCLALGFWLNVGYLRRSERAAAAAKAELDMAGRIHETLVPPLRVRSGPVEILGVSVASSEMGGDLIDAVESDGAVDVVIADVSGHGVAAGVVMAMTKGSIRTRLLAGGTVAEVAGDVNRVLSALTSTSMFVTGALVRLHADGEAECVVAGHPPVVRVTARGQAERIESRSMPMAVDAGEVPQSQRVRLEKGDLLAMMTDGFTETKDRNGRMIGLEPIERLLRERRGQPLEAIHGAVLDLVRAHGPQEDDRSMVLVRWS